MSYTLSEATTFTVTHARHIAAKVATDLKRVQRFYGLYSGGEPNDKRIADYEAEIIALLKGDYLQEITFGFRRNGKWIEPSIRYTARDLAGSTANDDDPGRIRLHADIREALFGSFLAYNAKWNALSAAEKEAFSKSLPFQRSTGSEPGVDGYLSNDRTYSSGGRALDRASVRSY